MSAFDPLLLRLGYRAVDLFELEGREVSSVELPNAPEPVLDGNARVWISTLYGQQWATSRTSTMNRQQVPVAREPPGPE